MAKQTEKKEFAWDNEKVIGEFGDSKKKTEVKICTLNGKTFVSAQTYVMSAKTEDWKRTKNNTMEMSMFKDLQEVLSKWEMEEAFKGTKAEKTLKKAAASKTKQEKELKELKEELTSEAKKSGGLKAKKQAQGARAKAKKE